jgi:hypothetical protein
MILVTLLWHVYIFAMCTGIFFATLFQSLNNKDISIKRFLKLGSVLLSSLAFLIYVSGHLYYDIDRSVPLFGTGLIVSNNFNAFFITGSESRSWANQYLGLGFILMAATLFFFIKRQHFQILKKHLWLCLLLASYFLYSLRIVDNILKDSPHFLYTIFDIMRMNSRFVWPVYYISCALAIVIITRSMGKKISLIFLIVFASLLQITDNSFYLKEYDDPHRSSMDKRLDWPFWKNEFKGKEKMFIYPTYSCSYDLTPPSFTQKKSYQLNREFYEIAARTKLISNSILTAKRNKNCTNEKLRGESGVFEKDSIYIYQKENGRNPIKPPKKCLDQNKHFKYGIYCKF